MKLISRSKASKLPGFCRIYGLCCTQIKDHDKSIDLHEMAMAIMRFAWGKNVSNYKLFGHCLSNMARDFELMEDYEKAKSFYEAARDTYGEATDMENKEKEKTLSTISRYIERVSRKLE